MTVLSDSSVFEFKRLTNRPSEFNPQLIGSLDFEMDLDLLFLERNNYTMLDMLSDIGGISSIMISAMLFLLQVINYNHLEYYMAA